MELSGKIFKVMPMETGEGKNGVWKKQQVIIEIASEKYPKKVAVTLWGELTEQKFKEGAELSVEIDVESREYNGKWYTDAKAWKINKNTSSTAQDNKKEATEPQIYDDLPF